MHDVSDYIFNRIGGRKTYLTPRSQLSQETLQLYQAFVNHIMQKSKSSENSSPRCKMSFWHSLCRRPYPMWQEMLLTIPDLSAFEECLGTRLPHSYCVGEMWYILTFDWLNLLNLYCMSSVIMAYGSTPYVGMTPEKNGGHNKSAQLTRSKCLR